MKAAKRLVSRIKYASIDHAEAQREEEDPSVIIIDQKSPFLKYKLIWLILLFVLTTVGVLLHKNKNVVSKVCITKPFSISPPYDDEFYFNLYNHWLNVTCIPVPEQSLKWLQHLWGPSPFKNETVAVRDACFEEINNTIVRIEYPSQKLLIGVSTKASDFQRRQLVRTHQIKPFNNSSYDITWRFIMFKPKANYMEAIKYENQTYGDLIILDSFNDSREASRTYKPYEWFKYIENNMSIYKYVAKLDSDCFLNIPQFWNNYFNETVQELEYAVVALFIEQVGKLVWPMGAFEAISWKTMLLINRLYAKVNLSDEAEDLSLGWYLHDAELNYTRVSFPSETAYDFRPGCNPTWNGDVLYNALRVHELKQENDYINVANCFDEHGVNKAQVDIMRSYNWTI